MLNSSYVRKSYHEIGDLFGTNFASQLKDAPQGEWAGPYSSAYGFHLVHITNRTQATVPSLSQIRETVLTAYMNDAQIALEEALYQELRSRYQIKLPENTVLKP